MNYIKRNLENVVRQVTREYPVLLVTGPRQVGKTTMLQKLMEGTERGYVTLDDLNERNIAKTDPELFLQLHKPPVLIDEVQYAPELFTYIKIYVDKNHEPGAFWLTGSQVFKLMQGVQESLAGRVAVLSLTSLSQAEISGGTMKPFTVDLEDLSERQKEREQADTREIFERIYQGSMPAIVSGINSNSQLFYSSYLSTYIERDVRELSDAIDSLKFLRFITAVAARCGQMVNAAEIARDADINQTQAKDWLTILETLGIIFYLHPYSNNLLKRLVKTPKLYFYDTGLVCYLTKWSSAETLECGAMNGAILENYVVAEIRKTYLNCGKEPYLYYYRDKDAREIDIVLEHDGILNPIEIKKTANPGSSAVLPASYPDFPIKWSADSPSVISFLGTGLHDFFPVVADRMEMRVDLFENLLILFDIGFHQPSLQIAVNIIEILGNFVFHIQCGMQISDDILHLADILMRSGNVIFLYGKLCDVTELNGSVVKHKRQFCRRCGQNLAVIILCIRTG
jgi:uncharacterized protein